MRILVLSDTHGDIQPAIEVYEEQSVDRPFDCIIHLGDTNSDARELADRLKANVIGVKGNMDNSYSSDDYLVFDTEFGGLLLMHGHLEHVKMTTEHLPERARERDCKAVLFGHTHKPCLENVNGIYLLNPGSISKPQLNQEGSYAILNTGENQFSATILFYKPKPALPPRPPQAPPQPKPSKTIRGRLRDLFNNSDRF